MKWFRLWGMSAGVFTAWTDWGWYYGSAQQAAELLGWLTQAGGASYWWAMADAAGTPVFPSMPAVGPSGGNGGGAQWPTIPGLDLGGISYGSA